MVTVAEQSDTTSKAHHHASLDPRHAVLIDVVLLVIVLIVHVSPELLEEERLHLIQLLLQCRHLWNWPRAARSLGLADRLDPRHAVLIDVVLLVIVLIVHV